jgi:TonB-linked SusC/RagA family outer membrane protein
METALCCRRYFNRGKLTKTLLVMKFTAIFLLAASLQVSAKGYSQKVTLFEKNAPLTKVFRDIKKQTGYAFFFDESWMKQATPVTVEVKDATLEKALDACFKNQSITYSVVGTTVVVKQRERLMNAPVKAEPTVDAPLFKEIKGVITDSLNKPLQGVSVKIKGTTKGTTTNANGEFVLNVNAGDVLEISYIGYINKEIKVGDESGSIYITLAPENKTFTDVVVTALGIKKERKSLGYAIQEVKGETLADSRELNLVNDLSGKVAGLQVTRSGNGPAGSSQITLRGNNSLTGGNQPLIVVDGVPMDNQTGRVGIGSTNDYWNPSYDMGNGLSDINAQDIESVSVLKGPAAAALYGSRAGNGAILITTKTGKKQNGIGITVSSSVGFESIFKNPDMQNAFGEGSNGTYDVRSNSSWGPAAIGQQVVNWKGNNVPLKTYNNVGSYYGNGVVSNQNISLQQQFKSTSIYTSYSRLDDKSMIPGAQLTRSNLLARAVTKFGNNERWTLDTKVQYNNSLAKNRPQGGPRGDNTFYAIYNLPRSLNLSDFKNPVDSNGNMLWFAGGNQVNPYWDYQYNLNQDSRDRFLLYGSLKYKFTDWLTAEINSGTDMYTTSTESKLYAGSRGNNGGSYGLGKQTFQEINYSTLFTARKYNVFGKLGGAVSLGGNLMQQKNSALSAGASSLVVPNLFSINNAVGFPSVNQAFSQKRINSLYGSVELNYDGYLFLNGTFRNDWSSTLSSANRSYFYPSVNASYVFTDMITKHGGSLPWWLSYGKLRASYASVGNDMAPYQLYNTYSIGQDPNGNTTASRGSTLYDPSVRSELIKSYEAGAEMRFFKNRFGFDIAVYKSNATRQLITLPMDPLSGYSGKIINTGDIQNKGLELTADARILSNPNKLNWTATLNYSTNNNTINSIYPGVPKYQLGGYDIIQILAVEGQKYGEIYGTQFMRVSDPKDANYGKLILTSVGLPQAASGAAVKLGNQQANGLLGLTNAFSYKGFGLSILLDARFGGKIFSGTLDAMEKSGTAAVTVVNGRRDSMVVNGVLQSGSSYTANTLKISAQQYWGAVAGSGNLGITEANLYDASNLRIRNVQLSYAVPRSVLARGKGFIQKAVVSVACNNVWLITSHMHGLDPESVFATGTNATGFENGSAPTTRTFFVNVTLGF